MKIFNWNKVVERDAFLEIIDHDSSLLDTVIELFKQQADDSISVMREALATGDKISFQRAAHDLKNIGRSVASTRLIERSHTLEKFLAEEKLNDATVEIDQTEKLLDKALSELNSIRCRM